MVILSGIGFYHFTTNSVVSESKEAQVLAIIKSSDCSRYPINYSNLSVSENCSGLLEVPIDVTRIQPLCNATCLVNLDNRSAKTEWTCDHS